MVRPQSNQLLRTRQWLLAFLCVPAIALGQARLLDRSVALIDGHVVTMSELVFETRVLSVTRNGVEAAFRPLDHAALASGLEQVIFERLELAEADKLNAYQLEEGELERALALFSERIGGADDLKKFLKAHDADQSMLEIVLTRVLRTTRVLNGKLKLKAQVSEVEAKNVLAERPELRGLPLAVVREKLSGERFLTLAKAELSQVRKAGAVRLLGPFAPGADGGAP